jgi:hypothetical protein
MYDGSQMLERLKYLVRIAAMMTNVPMEKIIKRIHFCFRGTARRVIRGSGMKSMRVSEEMLKQAWTIA